MMAVGYATRAYSKIDTCHSVSHYIRVTLWLVARITDEFLLLRLNENFTLSHTERFVSHRSTDVAASWEAAQKTTPQVFPREVR